MKISEEKQRLIFLNRQLDDGRVLTYYNINDRCTIHLTRSFFIDTLILLRTPSGQMRTIDVQLSDYIGIIKERIQYLSSILNDQQSLFFTDREWEDDRTLLYYSIQKDAILHLQIRIGQILCVFLKTSSGQTLELYVNLYNTITNIE